MMAEERLDNFFAAITDEAKNIENLLNSFFGFLSRRTDFFKQPDQGRALLLNTFEKYKHLKAQEEFGKQKKETQPKLPQDDVEKQIKKKCLEEKLEQSSKKTVIEKEQPKGNNIEQESQETDGLTPINNGGVADKYTWTQTLGTVDIIIPLEKPIKSSSLCKVNIASNKLKVIVDGKILIDGDFHDKVKTNDSLWTLEDHKSIHITLEKYDAMKWWACVIVGDPVIDTKKIQPENSKLSDLDPELRQTVEKMMFDQDQKARGLPTSDQRKQADILEAFKKQHPEMDFSQAKINWGNSNQFFNA